MKRFIWLAVAALAFVGCNNAFEDVGNSRLTPADLPTLTAGFEDADTRTYVEYNIYLRWHEDDQISAFYGSTLNSLYQFMGDTGANSGTFTPVASGNLSTGNTLDRIYAVYPYDAEATISDLGVISYSIPATQTYAESSFGKGSNTMVAVTENIEDTFLSFKNIGGYLKIKLYGEGRVKSIELRGNDGEKIAGKATITATYGATPMVVMADDASDAITLDCGAGVELSTEAENPTEFWIVVPPTTFEDGITVTVTNTEGGFIKKSTTNSVTIERNIIQPMAAVEVLEFKIAKPANNEIWYTSTDGEVVAPASYDSGAFGANIISNTYTDGKGVITFDGDVTTIGDFAFRYCDSLKSVTIPDSVNTIGTFAFGECTSLTSVTIPDSVNTIGRRAFEGCYGLTSVTIGNGVNTIGEEAFWGCFNLKEFKGKFASDDGRCLIVDGVLNSFAIGCGDTEYTIPDSVTTIGDYSFCSCESLTSVTIPDSVTTIGDFAFYSCASLTSVTIPDSVKTIGERAFCDCYLLTSVTIGESVTTIGHAAFNYCVSLESVTIPDSVNTIGGVAFFCCFNLKEFKGKFASDDGRCLIVDGVLNSFAIGCGDTEYTIPDSVTTIEYAAFHYCESLTSVTIPDSVKTIGGSAFHSCNKLTSVYCKATTPPSLDGYEVFALNADNRKIIVPSESLSAYRGAVGWSHYADDIVSEDWGSLDTPNVVISDQNDTTITLSWDTIDGASEYTLSIEGSIYGPYTTTETSYTFELPDAGSYSISVQAFDDEGNASYPVSIEFVMGDPNLADWFTQKLMTTAEIKEHGMDPSTTIAFTWKGENIVDFRYYANETSYITGFDDSVIIQNMHSANVYLEYINSAEGFTASFSGFSPNTSYTIFVYAVNDKGAKLFVRDEITTAASL